MELWDVYDGNFRKIEGKSLIRGQEIPEGIYHLVCDVLVKHTDGTYLLMQRCREKHFGGMWEASAGGSALKGETALQCAIRELREETGIREENMREVGRIVHPRHRSLYVEFVAVTDCKKDAVTLQPGETQAYRWATAQEILAMSTQELVTNRMQIFVPELRGMNL